ncbi:hypothetical protein C8R43DRAFT_1015596 [Mycena crocata]|nr:hypothetical protein C8R43DRAFT_1015596 [Mycena crocata]
MSRRNHTGGIRRRSVGFLFHWTIPRILLLVPQVIPSHPYPTGQDLILTLEVPPSDSSAHRSENCHLARTPNQVEVSANCALSLSAHFCCGVLTLDPSMLYIFKLVYFLLVDPTEEL